MKNGLVMAYELVTQVRNPYPAKTDKHRGFREAKKLIHQQIWAKLRVSDLEKEE